jgi:hypothetical protein
MTVRSQYYVRKVGRGSVGEYELLINGEKASSNFEYYSKHTILAGLIHYTQEQEALHHKETIDTIATLTKVILKQQETIEAISKRLQELEERIEFAPVDGNSEYDKAKNDYGSAVKLSNK